MKKLLRKIQDFLFPKVIYVYVGSPIEEIDDATVNTILRLYEQGYHVIAKIKGQC